MMISEDGARLVDYEQGFEAALQWIAQSFGTNLYSPEFIIGEAISFRSRQDIEHNLQVIFQTTPHRAITSDQEWETTIYWHGFKSAMKCIATSFGVELSVELCQES